MMKWKQWIAILPLLVLAINTPAQSYWHHLKDNKLSFGLMFTGGLANGVSDALQHKYSRTIFPQLEGEKLLGFERDFYDPGQSWKRKYKSWPDDPRPAYPGAKTWLVWSTDAWHFTKTVQLKSMQMAVVVYRLPPSKKQWWWPVADLAIHSLCFSAGWHLSDAIIVK